MRYSRAERIIQLALEMQSTRGGLTLGEIEEKFEVSRRTAIRMRDAVIRAFPQAKEVPTDDRTQRWRIPNGSVQTFTELTTEDLAVLETAAMAMKHAHLPSHAENLRTLSAKIRNLLAGDLLRQIDPDLEALTEAEGIAHRAGPRSFIPPVLFEAITQLQQEPLQANAQSRHWDFYMAIGTILWAKRRGVPSRSSSVFPLSPTLRFLESPLTKTPTSR